MKGRKIYSFWLVWPKEKPDEKDGISAKDSGVEVKDDDSEGEGGEAEPSAISDPSHGRGFGLKDLKQVIYIVFRNTILTISLKT